MKKREERGGGASPSPTDFLWTKRGRVVAVPVSVSVVRLKITLDGVEPKVLRRVEVPLGIRLDRLHLVIQAAVGWTDTHLYGFKVGRVTWGESGFDDERRPAAKTTLEDVLAETGKKTIRYVYDYGDNWDHTIKIERSSPADPGLLYPRLVEATGRCPPEDCGGPPGYEMFLEAMEDMDHPEHYTMLEWHGPLEDPEIAPHDELHSALEKLARSWAPKPSRP